MRGWLVAVVAACGSNAAVSTIAQPSAPAAPTCGDVGVILRGPLDADEAKGGPAREAAIAKACTTDRWATDIVACVANRPNPRACLDKLAPAQHAAYAASLAAWTEQYGGAEYGGQGYAASIAAPAAAGIPEECSHYQAAIEKLQHCDAMPKEARDGMKQAFDQAAASWVALPPEASASLAQACKAGTDAIVTAAKATCGW